MVNILLSHPNGFRFLEGDPSDYVVGEPVDTGCYGSYVVSKIVDMRSLAGFDLGVQAISREKWEKLQAAELRRQNLRQKLLVAGLILFIVAFYAFVFMTGKGTAFPLG